MDGCAGEKPLKRKHLALAESAVKLSENENAIVIGNRVSDTAIAQSGILSGVENVEGLASLPSNLSPADVRLWETSHLVDVEIPPEELVIVLKVASALGDTTVTKRVNKLAAMVINTDWKQSEARDAMLCCLFRLPSHLLHLVATACLSSSTHVLRPRHQLPAMMLTVPSALHPAILSAATTDGNIAFDHVVAEPVLLTLPFITVPSPGLLRIDIFTPPAPHSQSYRSTPATASLLARAAAAHPSLTSLSLNAIPLPPQWLRAFSACLSPGALPGLADLSICAEAHPGGCAEVGACLRLLPSLTSLDVSLCLRPQSSTALVSLSTYGRHAATPASLPHLRSLTYRDGSDGRGYSDRAQVWKFRQSVEPSCAHSFLSLISAPALTTLSLTMLSRTQLQSVLAHVARIRSLQNFFISGDVPASQLAACRPPAEHQSLPRLAQLRVEGLCATSTFSIASATAALAPGSLTELSLNHHSYFTEMGLCDSADEEEEDELSASMVADTCQSFCDVLLECTSLQLLEVPCILGRSNLSEADCCDGLAPALLHLTQLTRLWLRADIAMEHAVQLDGDVLSRVIAAQPQLRSLWLDGGGELAAEPLQPVLEAAATLRHVTSLDMSMQDITQAQMTELLAKLPSLRHLQTWRRVFDGAEDGALAMLRARYTNVHFELY